MRYDQAFLTCINPCQCTHVIFFFGKFWWLSFTVEFRYYSLFKLRGLDSWFTGDIPPVYPIQNCCRSCMTQQFLHSVTDLVILFSSLGNIPVYHILLAFLQGSQSDNSDSKKKKKIWLSAQYLPEDYGRITQELRFCIYRIIFFYYYVWRQCTAILTKPLSVHIHSDISINGLTWLPHSPA